MSTKKSEQYSSIGLRIAQERKRLKFSQAKLSATLGKSTATQISYEADETRPDADYFYALDELGADIYYVITGRQLEALKKADELQLLRSYRDLDDRHKRIIVHLVEEIVQSDFPNDTTRNTIKRTS